MIRILNIKTFYEKIFQVYQWKLLNHVAKDHNKTLKPAHLSYKCTVCTATFGQYKLFENHVYTAHSGVAKKADKAKQVKKRCLFSKIICLMSLDQNITKTIFNLFPKNIICIQSVRHQNKDLQLKNVNIYYFKKRREW